MAPERSEASGWVAWLLFAGVMLLMLGVMQAVLGIAGVLSGRVFTVTGHHPAIPADAPLLGWLQMGLATFAVVTACGLLLGRAWGRLGAGVVAFVNALVSFAFLDRYTWWAIAFMLFSIVTLWALVAHGDEVAGVYAGS